MTKQEKLTAMENVAFMERVFDEAYKAASNILADTVSTANVKRFSNIVIKNVQEEKPVWLYDLAFALMSIPATAIINENSPSNDIEFAMGYVYTKIAKAYYGEV